MIQLQGVNDFREDLLVLPCAVEPKLDGWRMSASREKGRYVLRARSGMVLDIPRIAVRLEGYSNLPEGCFLDGELTHPDGFQAIKGAIAMQDERLVFNVFDLVRDPEPRDYEGRKALLCTLDNDYVNVNWIGYIECKTVEQVMCEYELVLTKGFEGIVIKRMDSLYGYKDNWLRLKPTETQDCEIVGYELDHIGNLKSLIVLDQEGHTCKVGGSISAHNRRMFARLGDGALGMIVEVKHRGRFASGTMRHATYSRLRDDRPSRRREEYSDAPEMDPADFDPAAFEAALTDAMEEDTE